MLKFADLCIAAGWVGTPALADYSLCRLSHPINCVASYNGIH